MMIGHLYCSMVLLSILGQVVDSRPLSEDPAEIMNDPHSGLTGELEIHIPVRFEKHLPAEEEVERHDGSETEEGLIENREESASRHRRAASGKTSSNREYKKKSRSIPDFGGDLVFSARRAFRLFFDFDYSALSGSDIVSAQVLLYHTRPMRTKRNRRSTDDVRPKSSLNKSARVIMHQTVEYGSDFGTTRATDIKLVENRSRGWMSFDITPALKDWVADSSSNHGLELWIVSSTPGRKAARVASRMRFVKPSSERVIYRPELVVRLKQTNDNSANLTA